MTLLTVINDAEDTLTQTRSTAVYGQSGSHQRQILQILKKVGRDLVKVHDWQVLLTFEELTCASTEAQTGYPQTGFDRMADHTVMWNDTQDRQIIGPTPSDVWSELTVRDVTTLPQYWRLHGGVLQVTSPNSGDTIRYEYITSKWILQGGSTAATTFSADTDTFRFDEHLLTLGVVWRWLKEKGFDYAEAMMDYERYLQSVIKSDKGGLAEIYTDSEPHFRMRRQPFGTVTPY